MHNVALFKPNLTLYGISNILSVGHIPQYFPPIFLILIILLEIAQLRFFFFKDDLAKT